MSATQQSRTFDMASATMSGLLITLVATILPFIYNLSVMGGRLDANAIYGLTSIGVALLIMFTVMGVTTSYLCGLIVALVKYSAVICYALMFLACFLVITALYFSLIVLFPSYFLGISEKMVIWSLPVSCYYATYFWLLTDRVPPKKRIAWDQRTGEVNSSQTDNLTQLR